VGEVDPLGNRSEAALYVAGLVESLTWRDAANRPLAHTELHHDELGRLVWRDDVLFTASPAEPGQRIIRTAHTFDAVTGAVAMLTHCDTAPRAARTTLVYAHDDLLRLAAKEDALGNRAEFAYDANGNLVRITTTRMSRNARQWLSSRNVRISRRPAT
jgi:YD repeat-containing protein